MAKYVAFRITNHKPRKVWNVTQKRPKTTKLSDDFVGTVLGQILWFGRWRKYAFSPSMKFADGLVFEETCLRDIADFCERRTKEQRKRHGRRLSGDTFGLGGSGA